jgi:AraC-like DNA-binding protein
MSVLIRVKDEPPRTRLDYFQHVLSDSIVPFGVSVDAEQVVRAQILTGPVGSVHITKVTSPPMTAFRTSRMIRSSDPELLKIDVQVRGRTVIAQRDREASLAPGDFTLVDLSHPCQVADRDDNEIVAVKFPRRALALRDNELERLTAMSISGREGLGAPISWLARHLVRHLDGYGPTGRARLATALMDMLVVTFAERLDRVAAIAPDTRRRALLAGVQSFIDQRLGDPALSPSAIAADHNISLRYLYKLFEGQDATVGGWIRARRLERCRRDLLDPALSDWSVSAIAARWGLTDASHFSRVFRAAYGVPPAEYRRTQSRSSAR